MNTDVNDGSGLLKAVWMPFLGDGQDGTFASPNDGSIIGLSTDAPRLARRRRHLRVRELQPGSRRHAHVSGSQPLVILCRGDFVLDGTIMINGAKGGPGLDTDGNARYANALSIPAGGPGGAAGPGGGIGGAGGNPLGGGHGSRR